MKLIKNYIVKYYDDYDYSDKNVDLFFMWFNGEISDNFTSRY